jgi:hypothetical protein
MLHDDGEDALLRSVALQNANSILRARRRAEEALLAVQHELRESAERLQLAPRASRPRKHCATRLACSSY